MKTVTCLTVLNRCTGVHSSTGVNMFTVLYFRGVGVIQRWRLLPVRLYSSWVQVFNLPASLHWTQKQCDRCVMEMIIAWITHSLRAVPHSSSVHSVGHYLDINLLVDSVGQHRQPPRVRVANTCSDIVVILSASVCPRVRGAIIVSQCRAWDGTGRHRPTKLR